MSQERSPSEYLEIIHRGIAAVAGLSHRPKRVVIVGAGVAGLVAGYELLRAGHDPLILEARNRVGGRICTLREPFTEGLYGEAGAMRIPRAHTLTMAYIDRFALPTTDFIMESSQDVCPHWWGEASNNRGALQPRCAWFRDICD